jgi:hypothetical protein
MPSQPKRIYETHSDWVAWGATCFMWPLNQKLFPIIDVVPSVHMPTKLVHCKPLSTKKFCTVLDTWFPRLAVFSDSENRNSCFTISSSFFIPSVHKQLFRGGNQHLLIRPAEVQSRDWLSYLKLLDEKCLRRSKKCAPSRCSLKLITWTIFLPILFHKSMPYCSNHTWWHAILSDCMRVFSLLSLKRKVRLMRSPVCLSVCVSPPITFEPIGGFLWNSVPSTIPKWRTFILLRWMQNLLQLTWDHGILYTDRSSKDEQLLIRPILSKTKNTNMAAVWMLKFIIWFVEKTHEPLRLDKWTLVY